MFRRKLSSIRENTSRISAARISRPIPPCFPPKNLSIVEFMPWPSRRSPSPPKNCSSFAHLGREQPLRTQHEDQDHCRKGQHLGHRAADEELGHRLRLGDGERRGNGAEQRSEEHTSELQSLMRITYAGFC